MPRALWTSTQQAETFQAKTATIAAARNVFPSKKAVNTLSILLCDFVTAKIKLL